jgi:hypothetical protein
VAVRELSIGQPLPAPQTAGSDQSPDGPSGGVVRPPEDVPPLRRTNNHETRSQKSPDPEQMRANHAPCPYKSLLFRGSLEHFAAWREVLDESLHSHAGLATTIDERNERR